MEQTRATYTTSKQSCSLGPAHCIHYCGLCCLDYVVYSFSSCFMAISLFDMIRKAIYLDSTVMHELLSRCRRLLVGKHLSICFLWFILFRPSNKEPHKAFKKTNRCMLPFLPCLQINDSMPQLTRYIPLYKTLKGGCPQELRLWSYLSAPFAMSHSHFVNLCDSTFSALLVQSISSGQSVPFSPPQSTFWDED